jgi:isoquinoline 1-oxidoreductase beta subunit
MSARGGDRVALVTPDDSVAPVASDAVQAALSRRQFLGAGLTVAFTLSGASRAWAAFGAPAPAAAAASAALAKTAVNGWISVASDGKVTVMFGGAEMGQGILSGLAQAAAEELMVDWSVVETAVAPTAQSWITGGSTAARFHYQALRTAGATAREMLIAAAAQTWGVSPSACFAQNGSVVHLATGQTLSYAALAALAATMPVPASPPLVAPGNFRLIGKRLPRIDIPSKVNGSAVYGLDVRVPGMRFAVIKHCPTIGGTLAATPPLPRGAMAVVPLDNAVAVVAGNTWAALEAAKELQVRWILPASAASSSTAAIAAAAAQLLASGTPVAAESQGNVAAALASAATLVDATYSLPYLAHACMEVLNCTVRLDKTSCDIWAPMQAPSWVAATVAGLTGFSPGQINVHPTLLGGGLGRKIEQDYISQAVRVAKAMGVPVKLTWSREEDFAHDQYRPMALSRVRAGLDGAGNIIGWSNRIVSPSVLFQRGWIPANGLDNIDGAVKLPYALATRLVEYVRHPATIPVGFWRSVSESVNVFVVESMIDELAFAAKVDPVAFRQRLLRDDPRSLAVLSAAARLSGWGSSLPAGRARGIALSNGFGSVCAQVVEISQPVAGSITVHKVACVVDCGTAINPDSIAAQMEGGIVHGISAALWGQVTFSGGRASARNFSNYRMLVLREMPQISVQILESGQPIGGIGEVGVPPVAPALANAYFQLTGNRVRALPFFPGARMSDY